MSTVLWLRRLSFASDLGLCNGISKDALQGFKVNTSKVNTALKAGAFLQENFHLALRLCTAAIILLQSPTAKQKRGPRLTTAGAVQSVRGAYPSLVRNGFCSLSPGRELVAQHFWGPLGFPPTLVCKFRKCFRAGNDTHTQWDTPPGSETTPSCGWYVPHARRSGRNWTILELPRGRWHTGM